MKMIVVSVLVFLGLYWLVAHAAPFPFSHEQFGLYEHGIHRAMGVIFFIIAGVVTWKWQPKSKK
jgi:hypothetical protein